MTDMEAIRARHSRRTYTGPLAQEDAAALQEKISALELGGSVHIRLVVDGSLFFGGFSSHYGMFKGVHSLLALYCAADDALAREAAGYGGQRLVLEATKRGLGTCWVGGTYNKRKVDSMAPGGTECLAVIAIGPVKASPSIRERTLRVATHRGEPALEKLYTADDNRIPVWFMDGVRAAAVAPSAMNKKPTRFTWKEGVASAAVPEGGLNLVDLGIAKLHFEIAAGGVFERGNGGVFRRAE